MTSETLGDAVLYGGDCRAVLAGLEAESVQTCITSPPYFGLRAYGTVPVTWADGWRGELGAESHPDAYVGHLMECLDAVWRVLRSDGSLWLNIGDSYARDRRKGQHGPGVNGKQSGCFDGGNGRASACALDAIGVRAKSLLLIPFRVALALQAAGWIVRSDIVWAKPNPCPESVTDRPTRSHEFLFLCTKEPRYYYDMDAVREPHTQKPQRRLTARALHPKGDEGRQAHMQPAYSSGLATAPGFNGHPLGRNRRSVWNIATRPYAGAHFSVFPEALVTPCILAGCPPGGVVLDPFAGSGTVAKVALEHGRRAILIEAQASYHELIRDRLGPPQPSTLNLQLVPDAA